MNEMVKYHRPTVEKGMLILKLERMRGYVAT